MTNKDLITLVALVFMALTHVASTQARLVTAFKKHGWISFSAGASVAYVFVHVFPEIGIFQQKIAGHHGHGQSVSFINQPLYLAALFGLCLLYLLDTIESKYTDKKFTTLQRHKYYMPLFLVRSLLYILYNVTIAYIITQRQGEGFINLILIAAALMLHFTVINNRAYDKYGELFEKYMRWPAAYALILGWFLGILIHLPDILTVTVFSLIGGMITYIALKNELPHTKHRAPLHFIAGALLYSLLVLAIPFFGFSHLSPH